MQFALFWHLFFPGTTSALMRTFTRQQDLLYVPRKKTKKQNKCENKAKKCENKTKKCDRTGAPGRCFWCHAHSRPAAARAFGGNHISVVGGGGGGGGGFSYVVQLRRSRNVVTETSGFSYVDTSSWIRVPSLLCVFVCCDSSSFDSS